MVVAAVATAAGCPGVAVATAVAGNLVVASVAGNLVMVPVVPATAVAVVAPAAPGTADFAIAAVVLDTVVVNNLVVDSPADLDIDCRSYLTS